MQRRATTLIGVLMVGIALWIAIRSFREPKAVGRSVLSGMLGARGEDAGSSPYVQPDAGPVAEDGGTFPWLTYGGEDLRGDSGAGLTMPDGTPVPPLPFTIPRQIRFGVVLVSYAEAQPSPSAGRPATRSRGEARLLAEKLLPTAQQDFHAAVQQGDSGSADDIGRVKLGIVEPAPEYVLFTLPVDGVGGPVDTPRGYWIVKRLE
jgi:hypothetical protein